MRTIAFTSVQMSSGHQTLYRVLCLSQSRNGKAFSSPPRLLCRFVSHTSACRQPISMTPIHSSIFLSKMHSSITFTHSSVFFKISAPQNRMTVQPMNRSFLFTSSSRSMFREIFFVQNSRLLPFSSLAFKTSQSFP